jgi:CAAX prenyl protease-like protein
MISRAASGSFEPLYSLRLFAALAAVWLFRRSYLGIDWKVSWFAPLAGVVVFVLWIAFDRLWNAGAGGQAPPELLNTPPAAQTLWIVLRTMTAVVAVPVAEELAFRGFLLRRFISAHFEEVSFQAFTWLALFGSSLIFGLLHGQRWLAGTVAGVVYALALLRRGRLGDAVLAHAVTNALLAGYVLAFHRWDLW